MLLQEKISHIYLPHKAYIQPVLWLLRTMVPSHYRSGPDLLLRIRSCVREQGCSQWCNQRGPCVGAAPQSNISPPNTPSPQWHWRTNQFGRDTWKDTVASSVATDVFPVIILGYFCGTISSMQHGDCNSITNCEHLMNINDDSHVPTSAVQQFLYFLYKVNHIAVLNDLIVQTMKITSSNYESKEHIFVVRTKRYA